jgi:hypothetical protein
VLREEGIDVPPGVEIQVIESETPESSEEETSFWLPPSPDDEELGEDDLGQPPDVFNGGGGIPSRRTKPQKVSRLMLPTRPTAGHLIEDDLSLPSGVSNAGGHPTRRTKPQKV